MTSELLLMLHGVDCRDLESHGKPGVDVAAVAVAGDDTGQLVPLRRHLRSLLLQSLDRLSALDVVVGDGCCSCYL